MTDWRKAWAVWAIAVLAALPASAVLWFVGGQAWCGEETYNTPPGSTGDAFCSTLVEPIVPWAALAAVPFLVAAIGGVVAIRLRRPGMFIAAVSAPFVFVVFALFATLAIA
jgi:hypothetical protein